MSHAYEIVLPQTHYEVISFHLPKRYSLQSIQNKRMTKKVTKYDATFQKNQEELASSDSTPSKQQKNKTGWDHKQQFLLDEDIIIKPPNYLTEEQKKYYVAIQKLKTHHMIDDYYRNSLQDAENLLQQGQPTLLIYQNLRKIFKDSVDSYRSLILENHFNEYLNQKKYQKDYKQANKRKQIKNDMPVTEQEKKMIIEALPKLGQDKLRNLWKLLDQNEQGDELEVDLDRLPQKTIKLIEKQVLANQEINHLVKSQISISASEQQKETNHHSSYGNINRIINIQDMDCSSDSH